MNKNLIRHKTLEALALHSHKVMYEDNIERKSVREEELDIPVKKLWTDLKITETEFRKANVYLTTRKEVRYVDSQGEEKMIINQAGIDAYEDNKYLKIRNTELHESFYQITKWAVPIAALIVSASAVYFTANQKKTTTTYIYIQLKEAKKGIVVLDTTKIVY